MPELSAWSELPWVGVGPDVRRRLPGGPLDVTGRVPVRQHVVRRPEVVGDVLLRGELHLAELLPGRRLVLSCREEEHEVVRGRLILTDRGDPGGARVGAQVTTATVTGRAAHSALHGVLDPVLVTLGRHLVDAERAQLDPEPPVGVLHPVLMDGVSAVEAAGLVEEVPVERRNFRAAKIMYAGRVAVDRGVRRLRDHEWLVRIVDQHERAVEVPLRARVRPGSPSRCPGPACSPTRSSCPAARSAADRSAAARRPVWVSAAGSSTCHGCVCGQCRIRHGVSGSAPPGGAAIAGVAARTTTTATIAESVLMATAWQTNRRGSMTWCVRCERQRSGQVRVPRAVLETTAAELAGRLLVTEADVAAPVSPPQRLPPATAPSGCLVHEQPQCRGPDRPSTTCVSLPRLTRPRLKVEPLV